MTTTPGSADVAYATFTARARALVIDALVVGSGVLVLVLLSAFIESVPGAGRTFLVTLLALLFLYEPLMVSRYGATVGHRKANIRVVLDGTTAQPSFGRALARFFVKWLLGLPSFVSMLFTRRHQAIHDLLTKTTVQIRDLSVASDFDVVRERAADVGQSASPSGWRRLGIVIVYFFGVLVLAGTTAHIVVGKPCVELGQCSAEQEAMVQNVGTAELVAFLLIALLGWRGKLWGARRRTSAASTAPSNGEL